MNRINAGVAGPVLSIVHEICMAEKYPSLIIASNFSAAKLPQKNLSRRNREPQSMQRSIKSAILVAAALAGLAGTAQASIIVSEVDPSSSGSVGTTGSTVGADWFELTNNGLSAVGISGWRVDDNSNLFASSVALLGVTSIAPGQSVVFAESTNLAVTQAAFVNAWFGGAAPAGFTMGSYSGSGIGFGQGGDAVNIYDSLGTLMANIVFGGATVSRTFDNAAGLTGSISQLSAAGVNGAFVGVSDGRIGSPGNVGVVPVPAAAWLLGSALGLLGVIRRRLRS